MDATNLQGFWLSIGVLVIFGVLAALWIAHRLSEPKPKPPVNGGGTTPSPSLPAPSYGGALLLKPVYDEGERLIFQTTPQVAGCLGETVHYGIRSNNTGPYGVLLEAWRTDTGDKLEIYQGDGGPRCDGILVPSGVFNVYLGGKRPYSAIGSLVGCETFIPESRPLAVFNPSAASPKACNPPQHSAGGAAPTEPGEGQFAVVLAVTVMNRFGRTSERYLQTVIVQKQIC